MLLSLIFVFWRVLEIVTLIPVVGMLGHFVNVYANCNVLTPNYVLCLFIVSVLALAWAVATLFTYHRSVANAHFVAIVDLFFVAAFIAAVYTLRGIAKQNCTSVKPSEMYRISFGLVGKATLNRLNFKSNKQCALLKASFAFGIMNVIFFAITSVLAFVQGLSGDDKTETRRSSRRSGSRRSRHSSRRRSAYV